MNLTGKQLIEQKIVTGTIAEENIQQHGVDLNLIEIFRIDGAYENGVVPIEGKTKLAIRVPVYLADTRVNAKPSWYLTPGAYDITLAQGCKVPPDKFLLIRQRSSLLRNGAIITSSVFDAGFETERIGTVMIVMTPILIEKGARIAQIYAHNSNEVQNLYDGQWQGDKQRQEVTEDLTGLK